MNPLHPLLPSSSPRAPRTLPYDGYVYRAGGSVRLVERQAAPYTARRSAHAEEKRKPKT